MIQPLLTGTTSELERSGVIPNGQYCLAIDTGVMKVGDGMATFGNLPSSGASTSGLSSDSSGRLYAPAPREHTQTLIGLTNTTNTAVHAAVTLTAAVQTVTTGITNPDFYRCVLAKGNASGMTGTVTVFGTDPFGAVVQDSIALSGTSAVAGIVPMSTVTAIVLPVKTHTNGDTVSIGKANVFGLYCPTASSGDLICVERYTALTPADNDTPPNTVVAFNAWQVLTVTTDYTFDATDSTVTLVSVTAGDDVRVTYWSKYL